MGGTCATSPMFVQAAILARSRDQISPLQLYLVDSLSQLFQIDTDLGVSFHELGVIAIKPCKMVNSMFEW